MTQDNVKPVRVQRSRKRGFRLQDVSPNGLPVVYVGRPTKWGNYSGTLFAFAHDAEEAVKRGRLDVSELRGKNLACWCALDEPCHADIWLRLANQ